ncbi:hypothetical protein HDA32_004376 [Spinactinospora alkalitolerans]|uniref:DUF4345 domain-containing protein n=1 Tax=Spinactinospora alkalitolerans TaxID=687207 RepID=A0A852TXL9_9ACTN|nr:DUF4345 domain-containing protein [Spinactinospora alkalitolerans]NYE49256.1 hypothetical protein [Spinactinospora alkalitolerans]
MRRGLQVAVAVLALVPILTGLNDVLLGPTMIPGGGEVTPSVDGTFRFNGLFWLATGVIALWMVPRIEWVTTPFRLLFGLIFVGGLVRLLSVAVTGWPHPVFIGAMLMELIGMPLLILVQARVARRAAERGSPERAPIGTSGARSGG